MFTQENHFLCFNNSYLTVKNTLHLNIWKKEIQKIYRVALLGEKVHFMKLHLKFLRRRWLVHVACLNLLEYCVDTFFKFL
jgi:hypothetical protein